MPFCHRETLLCVLRSALATTNTIPALRSGILQRSAPKRYSVWSSSNSVSSTASSTSLPAVPQHLICSPSQNHGFLDTNGLQPSSIKPVLSYRLSPLADIVEYRCPSTVLSERLSQIAILDNQPTTNFSYECPVSVPVIDNFAPDLQKSEIVEPGLKPEAKEAKIIMRIRHKKMKKHKLKKLRKRMYFLWKKQKQTRKAKRMVIYNKELEAIKATGENFHAEEFVRAQLAKARRGGYYKNVFET